MPWQKVILVILTFWAITWAFEAPVICKMVIPWCKPAPLFSLRASPHVVVVTNDVS